LEAKTAMQLQQRLQHSIYVRENQVVGYVQCDGGSSDALSASTWPNIMGRDFKETQNKWASEIG
jgi:hypothetical protein